MNCISLLLTVLGIKMHQLIWKIFIRNSSGLQMGVGWRVEPKPLEYWENMSFTSTEKYYLEIYFTSDVWYTLWFSLWSETMRYLQLCCVWNIRFRSHSEKSNVHLIYTISFKPWILSLALIFVQLARGILNLYMYSS